MKQAESREDLSKNAELAGRISSGNSVLDELLEGGFETDAITTIYGPAGSGTDKGPPLVHRIYGPRKHGNAAFRLAVEWGVGAHHWFFGDMPKIKGVTEEEVDSIIIYIRALQRDAGFK